MHLGLCVADDSREESHARERGDKTRAQEGRSRRTQGTLESQQYALKREQAIVREKTTASWPIASGKELKERHEKRPRRCIRCRRIVTHVCNEGDRGSAEQPGAAQPNSRLCKEEGSRGT